MFGLKYKGINKDRRGSAAILLTIAFAAMIVLVTCLFAASKSVAGSAYADEALRLAGRSVMSEYDTELLSRYGIFAFLGDEARIEKDITFYADSNMKKDRTPSPLFATADQFMKIFNMRTESVVANLKEFSLLDVNTFEKQLNDAAVAKMVSGMYKARQGTGGNDFSDPLSGHKNRTLRDEGVIEGLPSYGLPWSFPDVGSLLSSNLEGLAKTASSDALISEYILSVFGRANDGVSDEGRFFDCETEYILSGKMNDRNNYDSVKLKLSLIRMAANNFAIMQDSAKLAQIRELAIPFAAAGGIGEEIARLTITELWAAAETRNDIGLFEEGRKVAFLKTPAQWALKNAKDVIDGLIGDKIVHPADGAGADYSAYLGIMLFLMDRETELLRIMDLIQINMKGTYNKEFLIREYYTGYRFTAVVGGDQFEYTEKY